MSNYKILKVYDHVLNDQRLTTLREKYLVSYVWSWQEQSKCCFASDEFLSSLLACDYPTLHKLLSDLRNRRILSINHSSGTARQLVVRVPGEPESFCEPGDIFDLYSEI